MGYIEGAGLNQGSLFPPLLDDFIATDHMCRVQNCWQKRDTNSSSRSRELICLCFPTSFQSEFRNGLIRGGGN